MHPTKHAHSRQVGQKTGGHVHAPHKTCTHLARGAEIGVHIICKVVAQLLHRMSALALLLLVALAALTAAGWRALVAPFASTDQGVSQDPAAAPVGPLARLAGSRGRHAHVAVSSQHRAGDFPGQHEQQTTEIAVIGLPSGAMPGDGQPRMPTAGSCLRPARPAATLAGGCKATCMCR